MKADKIFTLVTGGAGYIGTNVVLELCKLNKNVLVVDNFSNSYKKHITSLQKKFTNQIIVKKVDICNKSQMEKIFKNYNIDCVIHLAGKKYIAESFNKTKKYQKNNVLGTQVLLEKMTKYNVNKIVFSSSITVYGKQEKEILDENLKLSPLSPYSKQKVEGEQAIKLWATKKNKAIVLRLSNPVGANTEYYLGDDSKQKKFKNLLPYLISCANSNTKIVLNGNTHPTKDGTTVRDYINVTDIAKIFAIASSVNLESNFVVINVGCGHGFSVLDLLKQVEKLAQKPLYYSFGPRKNGDVSTILVDITKLKKYIDYLPTPDLETMVQSQYDFEKTKLK